ncbi:MAG: RHS repeat-associated core domain-containing protein, partial [Candidatus Methylumidiphilus sp.]
METKISIPQLANSLALAVWVAGMNCAAFSAHADSLGWKFEYDKGNRIAKVTDPAGRDTRMEYIFDESNQHLRKRVKTSADGVRVAHEYDTAGRLSQMTDSAGSVSYGYDERGRLNRVQRLGAAAIAYTYDTQDRVASLQVGDFYRIDYTYDFLGRLSAMKIPAGIVEYEYRTGQGQVVRKFPNGVLTISAYEPNGQLHQITHGYARNPKDTSYEVLAKYSYQYRPDGLIASIDERSDSGQFQKTYAYDTVGRLTSATSPSGQPYSYEYDLVGNRTKTVSPGKPAQTASYDWAGRMTRLDGAVSTHDAAGNLTALTLGGESMNYRYTPDNQLAEANGKVNYRYDGEGRLLSRKAGSVETNFINNPLSSYWQPLVMETQGGSRTLVVWEGATPLMLIKDGKPEYLLHDHLSSVRLVADRQGQVTRQFDYEPFGALLNSEAATEFAPRFASLFWDAEAKAYLTLARGYRPDLGRFIGMEPQRQIPFGSQEDLSVYAYCGDDPINYQDIDGKRRQKEPSQEYSPEMSKYVLEDIRQKEAEYRSLLYQNKANLTSEEKKEVRKSAVEKFFSEHAGYSVPGIGGYQYQGQHFDRIINKIMPTPYGAVNLDWATTLGHAEITSGISPDSLYGVGKTFWNIIGPLAGKKPLPELGYAYPIPDKNAITWVKALYNQNKSLEDVILPQTMRENQTRVITPDSITWHGAVVHTMGGTPFGVTPVYRAIDPFNSQRSTLSKAWAEASGSSNQYHTTGGINTSPVGGVYLGGAGRLLQGMGTLEGVSKDSNGNLILIGKSGADIKLPPLRLDDVVTVFRSVYLNGEGPTVTIDPSPEKPEESAMIIRHSAATEGTYVGWVLYHADRLMKGYNLGKNNLTSQDINSSVPGYANVLDTIYFGGGQIGNVQKGGSWERFWIVPAAARRFETERGELTLFDVPLKVRTQPMKWEKGKLVDDAKRNPSKGAAAFTEWFTGNYEGIAREQYLLPPPESGISEKVPVFTELRRIALLSALAEKLRDQGVPLPFWMRDYEIRPVPFEKITPALQITRSKERMTARIFGGVSLSPPDSDVKTFTEVKGLDTLPKEQQAAAQKTLDRSATLAPVVRKEMASAEPLQIKTFTHQGETQQALALPGADTLALAPAKLDEPDIRVPIEGSGGIQLLRSYNSFFNPSGPWGKGWAMNLPRLEEAKVPVKRDAMGGVTYHIDHELISPLNSVSARFSKVAAVPELDGSKLFVPDKPGEFLGLGSGKPDFLTIPTQMLIRKDGEKWHFTQAGDLIATEHNGFRTVYERDAEGRVTRIVGLQGKQPAASIQLSYDKGRLQTATGQRETGETVNEKDKATVNYEYDGSGALIAVSSNEGRTGYQYKDSRLVAVTYRESQKGGKLPEEKVVRRFEYNAHGQLLVETDANGVKSEYRVIADDQGKTLTVASAGGKVPNESVQYDSTFRPVEAQYTDGIKASWQYPDGGGSTLVLASAEGKKIILTESADQRKKTLELDPQRKLVGEYDTAGRLTDLTDNGLPVLRQEWASDGRLRLAANENTAMHPGYDKDGLVSSVLLAPPDENGKFKHFQETKLDAAGRPLAITDNSGLHVEMSYDKSGELSTMLSQRDGQNFGFQIKRDDHGRIEDVDSSWGKQHYT